MRKTSVKEILISVVMAVTFLAVIKSAQAAETVVKADGSSTVFPITEGISEDFQASHKGAYKVTVGVSGTGGGFKKFCRGETDIQDASRPILKEEMDACKKSGVDYYELPIAFDAIAIVVNKKNDWLNEITVEDLKKMWEPEAQGKILTWNQINPAWPKEKLVLFGASTDNGTFDYFTEAVMDKAKASRGDYSQSVDHNVRIAGVASSKFSLGYMPFAYYISNKDKVKIVAIKGGPKAPTKNAVLPTEKTVIDGTYFPLARPIFIYVNKKSLEKVEVKSFVDYYLKNGAAVAKQVQYVALPEMAYLANAERIKKQKFGTVFGGVPQVGLTIEQILKKETVK